MDWECFYFLPFSKGPTPPQRSHCDLILSPVIQQVRCQSMGSDNPHIRDGIHIRLHPDSVEIGKHKLDTNLFQPPGGRFLNLSFELPYKK